MSDHFYLNEDIYNVINENLNKTHDCVELLTNQDLQKIPAETYKNEYYKFIDEFPKYNTIAVKNIEKLEENKLKAYISLLFCKYITENIIKPISKSNKIFLFIKHKNFESIDKLTLPLLKKDFELIHNRYTIADYDNIISTLKGVKLRAKIISIIKEYVSKDMVRYTSNEIEKPKKTIKKTTPPTNKEVLIFDHENFTTVKNLDKDSLVIYVGKIYSTFKVKDYYSIFKMYKGDKLREKLIEIIEDYMAKGLVKFNSIQKKDITKPKLELPESPKKSPLTPLLGREETIVINVKKADNEYMKAMRRELAELESNEFNVDKFREDIKDNNFIKKAIEGHIKALEFKYKTYSKLSQIDWQGAGKDKEPFGKGEVNLNEIISNMQKQVLQKINHLKTNSSAINEKREELLKIIDDPDNGIESVKGKSRESLRMSLIKIIYMFIEIPVFFFKGFNNFVLTGPAGSGKTKVAGVIANLMKNLGILVTTNVIMATKQNLVGQYIGQSGPKTRNLLANGLEGVVFIDEAYTLTPCPTDDHKSDNYSQEVIGELINFMDKFMGCTVIIVAGYKDKMTECFLTFNEGIARRFPKMIELIPYNSNDLFNIFELFLNDTIDVKQILKIDQRKYIKAIIKTLNENKIFNNQAGDMLNLSKIIGEDAILNNKKYDKRLIKLSFKKFCLGKDIAIDFE